MGKKILPFVAALVGFVYSAAFGQSDFDRKLQSLYKNTVPLIRSEALLAEISKPDVTILDTRSAEEFQISHISGALFLDYDSFKPKDIENFDKNSKVIVYCSVGYRSERIGEQLIKLGFKDVSNLYGGIFDWINNGKPVVNTSGISTDSVHTYNKDWSRWVKRGVKIY
ncbi:MAG TPA: rhodanese-like domain-containing protein [Chryseolinea sp.]|nr:rhodanese-like domain-containing protein [Chryseolinea sp.]